MPRKLSQEVLERKWAEWRSFCRPHSPAFEGHPSEDSSVWLVKRERGFPIVGIPQSQWIKSAVHFLRGYLKSVMKEARQHIESEYKDKSSNEQWRLFKEALTDLHSEFAYLMSTNEPQ